MALRVMAGFEKEDGYFLPRGRACPSDELCGMVWPWVDSTLAQFDEQAKMQHPTALLFLQFMHLLRSIVIQDAAAMQVLLRR